MKITYNPKNSTEEIQQAIESVADDNQVKAIMVLIADRPDFNVKTLNDFLPTLTKPICGGLFPGLIFKNEKLNTGFIVVSFSFPVSMLTVPNISLASTNQKTYKLLQSNTDKFSKCKSLFVFVDGLAQRTNAFVEDLYAAMGANYKYIGGGAGSLSLKQQPCLISNQGILQDAAIVVGIETNSGIGVQHGWQEISGPYRVTDVERTVIKELDFRPAFDVYKEVIDVHAGHPIEADNFFEIAKAYPFGITKENTERIVRDPLRVGENNSLICVGEVEKGEYINILHGDKKSLLDAASKASLLALIDNNSKDVNTVFFVDCISRVLFLQNDFSEELSVVYKQTKTENLFGVLSLGEIAISQSESLEFHNKTAVVCCL